MSWEAAAAAAWKSSTMIADPGGSFTASLAIDAVTSADTAPSSVSRSAASAPNPGATIPRASTKPLQKRAGSASALPHDSQAVAPGGRAAAQLDRSTLLPAPADPTTTVSRLLAPAVSRSCSSDRVTSVAGRAGGRNFVSANRAPRKAPCSAVTPSATPATSAAFAHPKRRHKSNGHGDLREVTKVIASWVMVPVHPPEGADADPAAGHAGSTPGQQAGRGVTYGAITNV